MQRKDGVYQLMTGGPRDYYFAYGSNLYLSRLQGRVPSARFMGLGQLPGYQFHFNKVGLDQSGKGNIEPAGSEQGVWGAVFQVNPEEIPRLDQAESLGVGYERHYIDVWSHHRHMRVFTYFALLKDDSLHPFDWYKAYVVKGALALGLPQDYIQSLQAMPSIADPQQSRRQYHASILA